MPTMDADLNEPIRRTSPEDVPVQLNVKVPWHYREQLIRTAREKNTSLNRLVVNAIVRSIPPEQ